MIMAVAYFVPNSIWWVQLRLLGGARKVIVNGLAYASVLTFAILVFRRIFSDMSTTQYCDAALIIMVIVQCLVLIPGGCNAIHRAVARDSTSKMAESHRVSPLSAGAVVLGYLIGPTLQILLFYSIGTAFGAVLIHWGTIGVGDWLIGNAYMLLTAPVAWGIVILLRIGGKHLVHPNTLLFICLCFGVGFVFVPSLGLLTGFYSGFIGVAWMIGQQEVPPGIAAVPLAAAVGMAVIWCSAAMRKFRRPELPAFGTFRALGLLVIWLAAGGIALKILMSEMTKSLDFHILPSDRDDVLAVVLATVCISMVISLLPIASAAHARCRLLRGGRRERFGEGIPMGAVPLLSAALLTILVASFVPRSAWRAVVCSFVAVSYSLVAVEGLLMARASREKRGRPVGLIVFMIVFWALPPLAGLSYGAFLDSEFRSAPGMLDAAMMVGAFSPIGVICEAMWSEGTNLAPGVVFQILTGLAGAYFGFRSIRKLRLRRSALDQAT